MIENVLEVFHDSSHDKKQDILASTSVSNGAADIDRDAPMGVWGRHAPPIFSNLQESWSKVSQAARWLATIFSVTYFLVTI